MAATSGKPDPTGLPARTITEGPLPKHAQLRAILEELSTTHLRPGDILPGERALEEIYGVSRITVRRAIGDLVTAGRLRRIRGRGTFVAPNPLVSHLDLTSFSAAMHAQGVEATSRILLSERATAPEEVTAFFGPATTGAHTHLRRLRLGDNEPYAIDDAWYNTALLPDLLENDVYRSVYAILEQDYDLPLTDADQTVSATVADDATAPLLDVAPGTPLLHMVRFARAGQHPVEWCSSLYRTDRYRLRTRVRRLGERRE